MKALTMHQPWASLIALGVKQIETRSWRTSYRGPLAIHAALRRPDTYMGEEGPQGDILDEDDCELLAQWYPEHPDNGGGWSLTAWHNRFPHGEQSCPMPLGAVVAACKLVSCVPAESAAKRSPQQIPFGNFAHGRWAWLLEDIRPIDPPIPARGGRGVWTPDADLLAKIGGAA